jgi:hypothetical protein
MSLLQMDSEIVSQLQLQIERQKTIVPCSTNIGSHGFGFFFKIYLSRLSKLTKPQ